MRSYLILAMCGLFLIEYFVHQLWLQYLVVVMAVLAFISSAMKANTFPRWLGIMMMGTGIALEINKGAGIEGISQGILLIMPLLCLVILAPLLAIPLRLGGYFEAVDSLLRNLLHHPKKLFAGITTTLFILSPILNLGSVRIVNEFLHNLKLPSAMTAKSYLVGFSTSIMWSPYFASVSLVLYYLGIPFHDYIMYGIGLSFLSLLIGNLLFVFWEGRNPMAGLCVSEVPLESDQRHRLMKLILFVLGLMAASLFIEYITHWSMLVIVSLISLSFPLLWGGLSKRWKQLMPHWISFRDHTVPMMNNEIMLFLSAGLLGHAVQGTSFAIGLNVFLTGLANQSFILFALAIMIIVLVVTYVGIHQIAAVTTLATQLNAQELGISNIALAMLLLLAWSISTALSPFSGLNLMVSRISGITGVEVGLRENGWHLSLVGIIGIAIVSIMR
jgi:hypothetical protein